jgi:hypothetical protein
MSKNILIASGIGMLCVAIAVAMIFHMQRGAHIQVTAKILKVRTAPLEDNAAVLVADFRVTDTADYAFLVNKVTLIVVDAHGKQIEGDTISEIDARRIFEAFPLLGPKYNPSLILREQIAPHATVDRMTSARFEVADAVLQARKNLILRIEEADGRAVDEFTER